MAGGCVTGGVVQEVRWPETGGEDCAVSKHAAALVKVEAVGVLLLKELGLEALDAVAERHEHSSIASYVPLCQGSKDHVPPTFSVPMPEVTTTLNSLLRSTQAVAALR